MPIDNDKFVPSVVCNSYHNRQIAEWIAGRPVPTMEEMGAKRPLSNPERSTIRVEVLYGQPAIKDTQFPRSIPAEFVDAELLTRPPREAIPVRPVNDPSIIPVAIKTPKFTTPKTRVKDHRQSMGAVVIEEATTPTPEMYAAVIKRPPAIIGAPTRILPPPKKRA